MEIIDTCLQHNLPYDAFCQEPGCQSENRFGCFKCATFGAHKKHDCIEITELQQAIRDFQKNNAQNKPNATEIEAYNKCISLITYQIKQVRIKIDQLLVDLEKALVGEINSKNPANQMNALYQINPENIFAANDIDVQNMICQNVLTKNEAKQKSQPKFDAQSILAVERILQSYSNTTEQYIKEMKSQQLSSQNYEFSLDQF